MNLFGDTSAWLALYDRRVMQHKLTRQTLDRLTGDRVQFYVTDYVLDETLTLIRTRAGHATAVACGDWLRRAPVVRLIRLDKAQWEEAWALFKQYDDKEFSFTDCTSFVVMREHKLRDAFSFDHHFEQMGFRLWPR